MFQPPYLPQTSPQLAFHKMVEDDGARKRAKWPGHMCDESCTLLFAQWIPREIHAQSGPAIHRLQTPGVRRKFDARPYEGQTHEPE